jgi:hypothetical protein
MNNGALLQSAYYFVSVLEGFDSDFASVFVSAVEELSVGELLVGPPFLA